LRGARKMGQKTTFIVTGDSFMTRHLPEKGYEGYEELTSLIKAHDVRFNNLEFTAHNMEGYPSAFSGGTWAMAEPGILDDLNSFGFNLYNTANNHSMDYSSGGMLATLNHLEERKMISAGTGRNLATAAAPAFLECHNARVAMIGLVSTFHDSDIAGPQGPDVPGRPGLNPLRFDTVYHVKQETFDLLKNIADQTDMNNLIDFGISNGFLPNIPDNLLYFGGPVFIADNSDFKSTIPKKEDMDRTINSITDARSQADYVIVSIHTHDFTGNSNTEPAEYVKTFAHKCIDAGADAIIGHGPHELHGIEIYNGKPIFYSLGNFIFQSETVRCQPAEAFIKAGLPADSGVGTYMNKRSENGTKGYCVKDNIWKSIMAGFTAKDGKISQIKLYPIDLHMEMPRCRMGLPTLSNDDTTLKHLADISKIFGTDIVIKDGIGTISC